MPSEGLGSEAMPGRPGTAPDVYDSLNTHPMIPMPVPSEVEPTPLPVGTAVGSFVLGRLQTRDEFSIRYVAIASASGGEVVIEEFAPAGISLRDPTGVLRPRSPAHAALWEDGLEAFLQESVLLAKPLHPALMRVASLWEVRGTVFRMWPRFEARTLAEVCALMTEPPTEDWLRGLIGPLLDALESLHDDGWVHGNVCPGQILIRPGGGPMLLDTAAARTVMAARMPQRPAWPEPGFRPPELAEPASGQTSGPWSDLYSLAAVARFCMGAPHTAGSLSQLSGALPIGLYDSRFVSAFERALANDPAERPRTVTMFRQQLQATGVSPTLAKPLGVAPRRRPEPLDPPLSTTPLPDRVPSGSGSVAASASASNELERDSAQQRAWLEPADADPPWAREATRTPPARRWPWAVAGVLTVLVTAALATYQVTSDPPAPPLAGKAPTMLPSADLLLAQEPTAAGPVPAIAPDPRPEPPQTVVPQTPLPPVKLAVADPVRPRPVAERPERPASAAATAAMASPAPRPEVARRAAVADKPAALCAPRTNFALYRCMRSQCEQGRYFAHPQCVRLRQYDELPT